MVLRPNFGALISSINRIIMTTARPPLDLRSARIIPLLDQNALCGFSCGEEQIDHWVVRCCDLHDRNRARVFCAMQPAEPRAYGFYSLSMTGVLAKGLETEITQNHNQNGFVPFIYIDYLGVQREFQRQGLGTLLLIDALKRCADVAKNVAVYGVALHSLTPRTTKLYEKYGFGVKGNKSMQFPLMVLPMQTLFDLFGINVR